MLHACNQQELPCSLYTKGYIYDMIVQNSGLVSTCTCAREYWANSYLNSEVMWDGIPSGVARCTDKYEVSISFSVHCNMMVVHYPPDLAELARRYRVAQLYPLTQLLN